jgi:phosphoribosylaminoimidazole-succinocarboxamide synthase
MADTHNVPESYLQFVQANLANVLDTTDLAISGAQKRSGKVRDCYDLKDKILLVTSDRVSAFDRILASIPFKGQVLTQVSVWWFEKTKHIVPNHLLSVPDPNAIVGKKCTVFPIEFVVRGFMTGTTSTSIWTNYSKGVRQYCGHNLPDGMLAVNLNSAE